MDHRQFAFAEAFKQLGQLEVLGMNDSTVDDLFLQVLFTPADPTATVLPRLRALGIFNTAISAPRIAWLHQQRPNLHVACNHHLPGLALFLHYFGLREAAVVMGVRSFVTATLRVDELVAILSQRSEHTTVSVHARHVWEIFAPRFEGSPGDAAVLERTVRKAANITDGVRLDSTDVTNITRVRAVVGAWNGILATFAAVLSLHSRVPLVRCRPKTWSKGRAALTRAAAMTIPPSYARL